MLLISSSDSSITSSSSAHPAIFVIFNFVDFSCAVVFFNIPRQHAGHTHVAMVYEINTTAHAVRVVMSEIQSEKSHVHVV